MFLRIIRFYYSKILKTVVKFELLFRLNFSNFAIFIKAEVSILRSGKLRTLFHIRSRSLNGTNLERIMTVDRLVIPNQGTTKHYGAVC